MGEVRSANPDEVRRAGPTVPLALRATHESPAEHYRAPSPKRMVRESGRSLVILIFGFLRQRGAGVGAPRAFEVTGPSISYLNTATQLE